MNIEMPQNTTTQLPDNPTYYELWQIKRFGDIYLENPMPFELTHDEENMIANDGFWKMSNNS